MSYCERCHHDIHERQFMPLHSFGVAIQYVKRQYWLKFIPYTDEISHRIWISPKGDTLDQVKLEIKRLFNFSDCNFKIYHVRMQQMIKEITDISQFEKEELYEVILNC